MSAAQLYVGKFVWGEVVKHHEVGPYHIVEYHPRKVVGSTVTKQIDWDKVEFHLYIENGVAEVKDACESFESLDAALAGGIAYRAEGCNHRGDRYFIAAMEAMKQQ